jgi:hypothetical protein
MTELDDHLWNEENWSAKTEKIAELEVLLSNLSQSKGKH